MDAGVFEFIHHRINSLLYFRAKFVENKCVSAVRTKDESIQNVLTINADTSRTFH